MLSRTGTQVYDTQLGAQLEAADKQARQLGEMQIARWRADKGAARGAADLLPFCEELISATICNLLMPPCEGDG